MLSKRPVLYTDDSMLEGHFSSLGHVIFRERAGMLLTLFIVIIQAFKSFKGIITFLKAMYFV